MRPTFRIDGKRQTLAAYGELKKGTVRAALYRVLFRAADPLDRSWRQKAPQLTGRLAASGGVEKTTALEGDRAYARAMRAGATAEQAVIVKRNTLRLTADQRSFAEIKVGPGRNPQAMQREFGNRFQLADPYFRPAVEETREASQAELNDGAAAELDKVAARAARKVAREAAKARSSR